MGIAKQKQKNARFPLPSAALDQGKTSCGAPKLPLQRDALDCTHVVLLDVCRPGGEDALSINKNDNPLIEASSTCRPTSSAIVLACPIQPGPATPFFCLSNICHRKCQRRLLNRSPADLCLPLSTGASMNNLFYCLPEILRLGKNKSPPLAGGRHRQSHIGHLMSQKNATPPQAHGGPRMICPNHTTRKHV